MNLLHTLTDRDFDPHAVRAPQNEFEYREASRAIVFNDQGEIALMDTGLYHAHKLPGGSIENGETPMHACVRECMEETGYATEITAALGYIDEYKNRRREHWRSYCYVVRTVGEQQALQFTQDEIEADFKLMWIPLLQAIELMLHDTPYDYDGRFILKRDLHILQHYQSLQK